MLAGNSVSVYATCMNLLRRPLHPSWLIGWLCLGVVVGVSEARLTPDGMFNSAVWLVAGGGLAVIGLWRKTMYAAVFMILAGLVIGLFRSHQVLGETAVITQLVGKDVILIGRVADDVDIGKRGEPVVRLGDIEVADRKSGGTLWITLAAKEVPIQRSDIVTIRGQLAEGFGSFAGVVYRAELLRVQRPEPGDLGLKLRDWFAGHIRRNMSEPQASLAMGFLLGQRRSLPDTLEQTLRAAGLMHIVVASGYNLTILVNLARKRVAPVSKYLAAVTALVLVGGFIAMSGLSPSMVRAGIVTVLSLFAWYYGHRFHPGVLLGLAAAASLLLNPTYGWGDIGWLLSFLSFVGVLMVAPLLRAYFFGDQQASGFKALLFETVSAQIMTLPLVALTFGEISAVALPANLITAPFIPLVMLCTFLTGISSWLLPPLGGILGWVTSQMLGVMIQIATLLTSPSWAKLEVALPPAAALIMYAVTAVLLAVVWWRSGYRFWRAVE